MSKADEFKAKNENLFERNTILLNENERLKKENAELKRKILNTQDAVTMQMYTNKANKEIADKQLTKAKEIIKDLLSCCRNYPQKNAEKMEQAEQFLKDIKEG